MQRIDLENGQLRERINLTREACALVRSDLQNTAVP